MGNSLGLNFLSRAGTHHNIIAPGTDMTEGEYRPDSGPLFTKRMDVLPQNLVKSGSHKIWI